jgi:hypothetical protein
MITDEVLEIDRINAPQAADFDRSQIPSLDACGAPSSVDLDFR